MGDERTLKEYLKYLEDAGLICLVMRASSKMRKIEAPEKIYLDNPNQIYAICKQNLTAAYLAIDDVEYGSDQKIPLWLLGFLC